MQLQNRQRAAGQLGGKPSQAWTSPVQPSPAHLTSVSLPSSPSRGSSRAETELTIPALVRYLISGFRPFFRHLFAPPPSPPNTLHTALSDICQVIIDNCLRAAARWQIDLNILIECNKWVSGDMLSPNYAVIWRNNKWCRVINRSLCKT